MKPDQLESLLTKIGLTFERISLKTRPFATHWHIRKPGEKGTLEATLESGSIVFDVRANRQGAWIEDAKTQLESIANRETI